MIEVVKSVREQKLDSLFRRAEKVIKRLYPVDKDRKDMPDDLTAICVAHLSNYLPEIIPEARPYLARIVSLILDLEIGLEKEDGLLSKQEK